MKGVVYILLNNIQIIRNQLKVNNTLAILGSGPEEVESILFLDFDNSIMDGSDDFSEPLETNPAFPYQKQKLINNNSLKIN